MWEFLDEEEGFLRGGGGGTFERRRKMDFREEEGFISRSRRDF